ncbi:MAG: hypothetical protein GKR94_28700 [Gammaproteobacteria bacterium]|nr:hypothetical protein [Gammaproteobacteria bacterium]
MFLRAPATLPYTSPRTGRGRSPRTPARNRAQHAERLAAQLEQLDEAQLERSEDRRALGLSDDGGLYLTFESAAEHELKFESLQARANGIELCNCKADEHRQTATVFVPGGKLDVLLNKVLAYADPSKDSPNGKARNKDLVESIENVKKAALRALRTDEESLFPDADSVVWWEVWLRSPGTGLDALGELQEASEHLGIEVRPGRIAFLDRTIVLVRASVTRLTRSSRVLGSFAELRAPKTAAAFFIELDNEDQAQWVDELLAHTTTDENAQSVVCMLDTGLNSDHPLIAPFCAQDDLYTYSAEIRFT